MIARYAVMGDPIEHSLSPVIHQLFAEQTGRILTYEKIQITLSRFEQQVADFFNSGGLGLNITLPCKQRAFELSDNKTARCLGAGVANVLWQERGQCFADNTDGIGFIRDLQRYMLVARKKILLIGAGGAARGILRPLLAEKPASLTLVNRTRERAHRLQRDFSSVTRVCGFGEWEGDYDLVINATSTSLSNEALALPDSLFSSKPLCYDLAYRLQGHTLFVEQARRLGCSAVDGLGMLVEQAAEAFFIWHQVMPKTLPVLDFLRL